MQQYADKTCDNDAHIPVQCHDFSARGLDDEYQRSQIGHLTQFIGTDSVAAIDHIEDHYNQLATSENPIGVSVPATEHSVMCMGGKETELETFQRLNSLYPNGIVSIVSDTWDYWKVLTEILPAMKGQILARQDITDAEGNVLVPGRLVVRPDSGDPVKIITGYTEGEFYKQDGKLYCRETGNELTKEEVLGSIEVLGDIFGFTENEKGYRMLDSHIGLIYGDSITAKEILERLERMGWASSNVVFGIGSYTYQYMTRDNLGFAVKATYGIIDGEEVAIQKDPKTDSGTKKSIKGIPIVKDGVTYTFETLEEAEAFVFANGADYITLVKEGEMKGEVTWNSVCSASQQ